MLFLWSLFQVPDETERNVAFLLQTNIRFSDIGFVISLVPVKTAGNVPYNYGKSLVGRER